MARINVEEIYWTDPRRDALAKAIGNDMIADGAVIRLWHLAQKYWLQGGETRTIPEHVFEHVQYRSELVRTGFAVVREHGVYVRGCSEAFQWIEDSKKKNSKAGKISAQKRKEKYGSSSPNANAPRTGVRTEPERVRTDTNAHEHDTNSSSLSSSSSSSLSKSGSRSKKSNAGIRIEYPEDFQKLWLAYGKGDKKAAYQEYCALSLDEPLKKTLEIAIQNYQTKNPEPKYRKDFERFLKMDWREWEKPPLQLVGVSSDTQERHELLERFKAKTAAREAGGNHES